MKVKKIDRHAKSIAIIMAVRYMLLVPILWGLGFILFTLLTKQQDDVAYRAIDWNLHIIAMSLIAMMVTFAFARLEKRHDVHLPRALLLTIMLFVVASIVLGDAYGNYGRFWWWDDVLHALSGIITGLVGFLLVYFFNARYNMHISPRFVAVFAFSFAITLGVIWEIIEFSIDVMFGTEMQRWNMSASEVLIGKEYQGSGLRDTMSDLIVAGVGALVASVFSYMAYKNDRKRVLYVMRRTFPRLARKRKTVQKV